MPMETKYKATLRIPTRHQYAYIEVQIEGTPQEIVNSYLSITSTYQTKQKEWDTDKPPF